MFKESVHIGSAIKRVVNEKGLNKSKLAGSLNMSVQNLHKIFDKDYVDTKLLIKISRHLDHDFFEELYESDSTEIADSEGKYRPIAKREKSVMVTVSFAITEKEMHSSGLNAILKSKIPK
jgi:DNA-binding Xre family transcriptional regulator